MVEIMDEIKILLELIEKNQTPAWILALILGLLIMRSPLGAVVEVVNTLIKERQNAMADMRQRLDQHNQDYQTTKQREKELEARLDTIRDEHTNELKDIRAKQQVIETKLLACNDEMEARVSAVEKANQAEISQLRNRVEQLENQVENEKTLRTAAEKLSQVKDKEREIALIAQARAESKAEERQKTINMLERLLKGFQPVPPPPNGDKILKLHTETEDEEGTDEETTESSASKKVS